MEKFKCYKVLIANECREGCTIQCADCKADEAEQKAMDYVNDEIIREAAKKAYPAYGYNEEAYCDLPQDFSQPAFIKGAKWMAERMYSETEAKILVGKVSAELGVYLIKCIMQKNNNPETEKKFEELFDKYKKK